MRISWTLSRKLALGFAVIVVVFAGATRTHQTSSQSTSPTSPTRLVQTT